MLGKRKVNFFSGLAASLLSCFFEGDSGKDLRWGTDLELGGAESEPAEWRLERAKFSPIQKLAPEVESILVVPPPPPPGAERNRGVGQDHSNPGRGSYFPL